MKRTKEYPLIAMRGKALLPGRVDHLEVSGKAASAALEAAVKGDEMLFLVAQRDPSRLNPEEEDLFEIGTLAVVRQAAKLPQSLIRITIEGKEKLRLVGLRRENGMLIGRGEAVRETSSDPGDPASEAMRRILVEKLKNYGQFNRVFAEKDLPEILNADTLDEVIASAQTAIPWEWETAQRLLECTDPEEKYGLLISELVRELQVSEIRRAFQMKLRERVEKNQKDYILREQIRLAEEELGENGPNAEYTELEKKADALNAPDEVKERIRKEIGRMRAMPGAGQEVAVVRNYVDTMLSLPWNKMTRDSRDLDRAEQILDEDHYGLEKVKERIIEHLAVRILNKNGKSPVICLVGPPGTGKTSIAKSVARALNRKYVRISLGGVRDEAEIRGHRRTYVAAMPGRIAAAMKEAGTANPLMLLDEIDKVSGDHRGDTASALLEVLDGEQNMRFHDHYIEIPIDLSKVFFICTANTTATIPPALLDRMEVIELSSYTDNEKLHIAKEYLVEKQRKENGIPEGAVTFTDGALKKILRNYTREAGVRKTERRISEVYRKCAKKVLKDKNTKIRVDGKRLVSILGKEPYPDGQKIGKPEVGIVHGLAWTSVGGTTLEIEVAVLQGKGAIVLTGKLGDVMRESAQAALTCVRKVAGSYGVRAEFFQKHDLHVHIPEGAVPKDGPSAGITMAAALLSAAAKKKVRPDVCMTGEITLTGRVLPVGGLKEKVLAAKTAEMKTVIVPEKNRPDIGELSSEITGGLEIVYVSRFEEVVKRAFLGEEDE